MNFYSTISVICFTLGLNAWGSSNLDCKNVASSELAPCHHASISHFVLEYPQGQDRRYDNPSILPSLLAAQDSADLAILFPDMTGDTVANSWARLTRFRESCQDIVVDENSGVYTTTISFLESGHVETASYSCHMHEETAHSTLCEETECHTHH